MKSVSVVANVKEALKKASILLNDKLKRVKIGENGTNRDYLAECAILTDILYKLGGSAETIAREFPTQMDTYEDENL